MWKFVILSVVLGSLMWKHGNCENSFTINEEICGIKTQDRIVGGTESEPGEWPWMAYVITQGKDPKKKFQCGGTLLSPRVVLTAAHCLFVDGKTERAPPNRLFVSFGVHDLRSRKEKNVQKVGVLKSYVHQLYSHKDYVINDIALLLLTAKVTFTSTIRPICLPDADVNIATLEGINGTITGWGLTSKDSNTLAPRLQEVQVPIVSPSQCRAWPDKICVGVEDGQKSPCKGDSGGPYSMKLKKWTIIGISSSSHCGYSYPYSYYTSVPPYLEWIRDVILLMKNTEIFNERIRGIPNSCLANALPRFTSWGSLVPALLGCLAQ